MPRPALLRDPRLHLAALLLVVAAVCAPKLGNDFVWDDLPLIVTGERIHDFANLPGVFLADTMATGDVGVFPKQAGPDTYRPVTLTTFFVDARLSGREPLAYHLDNLLAHLACVALVYAWGRRLLGGSRHAEALAAAAFFGLHPLLAEAHVWVNGRSDIYCTLFGLAGALLWLRPSGRARAAAGLLFLLALLSKETVAPFLLLLLAVEWIQIKPAPGEGLRRALPVVLPLAIYVALRAHALSGLHLHEEGAQPFVALQRLPVLLLDGLWDTLAPGDTMPRYLNEEYARLPFFVPWAALSVVFVASVGAFRVRHRLPALSLGFAGFVLVLAPASLVATMASYGFGRFLYLPIALLAPGLAELGAWAVRAGVARRGPRVATVAKVALGVYLAAFGIRLALSARAWDGPVAFYEAIIAESPEASHGYGGLGRMLVNKGKYGPGIEALEIAAALGPRDSRHLNNLAVACMRAGRIKRAREVAELGRQRFPGQEKFDRLLALTESPLAP